MNTSTALSSTLGPAIASYLELKRTLGRRFANEAAVLADLDHFLFAREPQASLLNPESFSAWTLTLVHLKPTVRRGRMRIVRNLCLYLRRSHPDCFVPDAANFSAPHPRHRPHIFTEEEILRALNVAATLRRSSTSPLCPEVFRLAIVVLYTTGLRRGELVRLTISDYDRAERTLVVRSSKFHKSRLVALSQDATREIELYLKARCRLPYDAQAPLLIRRWRGVRAYSGTSFGQCLHRLFGRAGIRTEKGLAPRVHDLRHTYAVHALLRWYRAGVNVQAKLPALAIAMGHVSISSTAYYLSLLDPVAQLASELFAQHYQQNLTAIAGEGGGR